MNTWPKFGNVWWTPVKSGIKKLQFVSKLADRDEGSRKMMVFSRFDEVFIFLPHDNTHQMSIKFSSRKFYLSLKFGSEGICDGQKEARTKECTSSIGIWGYIHNSASG